MIRIVLTASALLAGVLLAAPSAQAAIEPIVRRPAHAYLPGAHELPPGLVEVQDSNKYEELPNGSFAARTFQVPPVHAMTFFVFVHDDAAIAQEWLISMVALGQQKGMACNPGDGSSGAEEEHVCAAREGYGAGLLWAVRVGNRASAVITEGPATTTTVQLSQAAARIQVFKFLNPG